MTLDAPALSFHSGGTGRNPLLLIEPVQFQQLPFLDTLAQKRSVSMLDSVNLVWVGREPSGYE